MGVRREIGALPGCLVIIVLVPFVHSHVRFVCPRPRSPRTDLTEQLGGICGLGNPGDDLSEEDITIISPGPLTLRFEETHFHSDSPFHISLHSYDNNSHWCSLLNQIPHNNQAAMDSTVCKDNDYPIGHCSKSTYYVTVKIPDIACERCYLKLSFMTLDKVPMSNLPCEEPNGTCKTYVSCANIKIQPSHSGQSHGLETCTNYSDNLLGKWPYTQQQIFQTRARLHKAIATLSAGVTADFTFDYYDMSLSYHILTKSVGHVLSVNIYHEDDNKTPVLRQSVSLQDNAGDSVTGKWIHPDIPLPQLIFGKYKVEIGTTGKTYRSQLRFLRDTYEPNIYVPHRASYSAQGWLNGPEFVGPGAFYSEGIRPVGECAPQPHHYIASVSAAQSSQNLTDHVPHGVLSADFLDNRVHVSAMFHDLSSQAQSVTLHGPILAGAKPLTIPLVPVGGTQRIFATLEASDAMPYLDTTMFFKRVTVNTAAGVEELSGDLEMGMRAVITGPSGFYGNAVFQFLKDGSLYYSILLSLDRTDRVKSITLNGPAHPGNVGPVILELTDYFIQEVVDYTWFANNTIQNQLSSSLLLHLWQGHLYVDVKLQNDADDSRLISGQISSPGSWYCDKSFETFCPHMNLYLHGEKPDLGSEEIPTSAEAVFYIDRANALQYSIQVKFSKPHEVTLSASVMEGQQNPLTISKFKSSPLSNHQVVHEVNGHLPQIAPDMERLLKEGKLKVVISTSVYPDGVIVGNIPQLERPHCIKASRFNINWDMEHVDDLDGLNVVEGDVVLFTYGQNDTVYKLADRNKYRTCDFTNATPQSVHLHPNMKKGQAQLKMNQPGEFYFASELNCNNSLLMAITVTGKDKRPFEDCSTSVFRLWLNQKLSSRGGTGAVGAIIGASFLAVLSLLLIVFFDRKRKFQSKSSSGFQRF